jgi:uncharacterized protein YjiK
MNAQKHHADIIRKLKLPIAEPSDICFSPNATFIIPSDDGKLYEIDSNGMIIKKSEQCGFDLEACCFVYEFIYVGDESYRTIYQLNANNLIVNNKYTIAYNAGRNKGIEGICYDGASLYAVTEKDPPLLLQLDKECKIINSLNMKTNFGIKEMSAITFHNHHLWILSDEERTIYEYDYLHQKIINTWQVNILNPEGICFDNKGNCIIVSDNMATLYCVNLKIEKK